jgi:hypothetical protein
MLILAGRIRDRLGPSSQSMRDVAGLSQEYKIRRTCLGLGQAIYGLYGLHQDSRQLCPSITNMRIMDISVVLRLVEANSSSNFRASGRSSHWLAESCSIWAGPSGAVIHARSPRLYHCTIRPSQIGNLQINAVFENKYTVNNWTQKKPKIIVHGKILFEHRIFCTILIGAFQAEPQGSRICIDGERAYYHFSHAHHTLVASAIFSFRCPMHLTTLFSPKRTRHAYIRSS